MSTSNSDDVVLDPVRQEAMEAGLRQMHVSLAALGPALSAVKATVPPPMARGVQARENGWRRIEQEFGLLTAPEVADLLGSQSSKNRNNYAADKRKKGKLLGVRRRNAYLYPGFQFDDGRIRPVIAELIQLAEKYDVTHADLVQWLCLRTRQFGGGRPVEHLSDPQRVLDASTRHFGAQW